MENFETNNRKFANTLTTDGTSLCVQVNVDRGSSLDEPHQLFSVTNEKRQFHPMPQYNRNTNVIGLDPGRSDLFVTTNSLDNSTSCSSVIYQAQITT